MDMDIPHQQLSSETTIHVYPQIQKVSIITPNKLNILAPTFVPTTQNHTITPTNQPCHSTTPNHSAQDISSNKPSTPKELAKKHSTIILLNAESLANKIEIFNGLLKDAKPSIAFVTETWFSKENIQTNKNLLPQKDYHIFTTTRSGKLGGGVAILVNKAYAKRCAPIEPSKIGIPAWLEKVSDHQKSSHQKST
jgi:hypothetical protein